MCAHEGIETPDPGGDGITAGWGAAGDRSGTELGGIKGTTVGLAIFERRRMGQVTTLSVREEKKLGKMTRVRWKLQRNRASRVDRLMDRRKRYSQSIPASKANLTSI